MIYIPQSKMYSLFKVNIFHAGADVIRIKALPVVSYSKKQIRFLLSDVYRDGRRRHVAGQFPGKAVFHSIFCQWLQYQFQDGYCL